MNALRYYRQPSTFLMTVLGLTICLLAITQQTYAQACKKGSIEVGRQNTLSYVLEILTEETVTCDDGRQFTFTQKQRNDAVIGLINNKRNGGGGIAFVPTPTIEERLRNAGANDALISLINQEWARNTDKTAFTIRLGDEARRDGKFDEAIVNYDKALELDPNNGNVFNNRALAYKALGLQYKKQGEKFKQEKNEEEAVKSFAESNKNYDKAIEDFTRAILADENASTRYFNRGICHYEKPTNNNLEQSKANGNKAIEDFTQAIFKNPDYKDGYEWRANTYRYLIGGKEAREKAVADYQECIKLGGCRGESIRNFISATKPD